MRKRVSSRELYPMVTIESINPNTLDRVVDKMKNEGTMPIIEVIDFKGYYIIVNGNCEMLAANILGKEQVEVEILSVKREKCWISEESIQKQLDAVGMNALYDFEAIGGFEYSEYPAFYNGGK